MPYIPHTDNEIKQMLTQIGEKSIDALFDEIPSKLRCKALTEIPEGLTELGLNQWLDEAVMQVENGLCFVGGGAYEHHIPAAVWDLASRGEFLTAYTPYQAEASQGTLQLLYEYQTMIASLTGMDVANASMYDGASALAESVLMAVRLSKKKKSKCVVLASTLHPFYCDTIKSIVCNQNIELICVDFDLQTGATSMSALDKFNDIEFNALIIQQPNFMGCLEQVDVLTNWAHAKEALVVACVNPTSLALLKSPGCWGEKGADIVCGEGQPLGVPLASGGPYFGFMSCKQQLVRQMPGRIIGLTHDVDGKRGFTLTLQAREQHIRRSKARSNICTNQGLLVTAATIYMSLLGAEGLKQVALHSHHNTKKLIEKLTQVKGVEKVFDAPFFHEAVIRTNRDAHEILALLQNQGILGGIAIEDHFPQIKNGILLCATETKTQADLNRYANALADIMK